MEGIFCFAGWVFFGPCDRKSSLLSTSGDTLRRIDGLVPQVLDALAKKSYPDETLVSVKKLFGDTERAAWQVAVKPYEHNGSTYAYHIYLLSNGEFVKMSGTYFGRSLTSYPPSHINLAMDLEEIEIGLKELFRKYT